MACAPDVASAVTDPQTRRGVPVEKWTPVGLGSPSSTDRWDRDLELAGICLEAVVGFQ